VQAALATLLKRKPVTKTIKNKQSKKMDANNKTTTQPFKRFRNLLLFLTGMATGYSFCHLCSSAHRLHHHHSNSAVTIPAVKNPAVLQKEVAVSEKNTDRQLQLTEQKNNLLKQQLQQSENVLAKAKQKNYQLQVQLYEAFAAPAIQPDSPYTEYINSPGTILAALDTLAAVTAIKDSLHTSITANLQLQLDNKDSAIAAQDSHIRLLKNDFDIGMATIQILQTDNRKLARKIKRQRVVSKLKSAGLLVLSGLALKTLIH
jgi:hypothetical protein